LSPLSARGGTANVITMSTVLVVYASKHGSTAAIATELAHELDA
jgi:hypothetical protein